MDPVPYYQATLLCLVPFFHHLPELVGDPANRTLWGQAFSDWQMYAWGGLLGETPRADPALAARELAVLPWIGLINEHPAAQLTVRERLRAIARARRR